MENKIDKRRNAELSHPSERFLNGAESGCGRCLLVRAGILKPMELEGVRLEESRTPHTKEFAKGGSGLAPTEIFYEN